MKRINQSLALILIVLLAILFLKNRDKSEKPVKTEPAKVEAINGSDLKQVVLTAKAFERLGIETSPARLAYFPRSRSRRLVVSYSSLIYGLNGETWVYTSPEPLNFIRHRIEVDYIDADLVVLNKGPGVGTEIVTVGVAELYGVETGVGK